MTSPEGADRAILSQMHELVASISDRRTQVILQSILDAIALNPQPLPPAEVDEVALNPQPLPPGPDDAVAVHPEPEVHGVDLGPAGHN